MKYLAFVLLVGVFVNWSCDPNPEPIEPSYLDTTLIKTFTFPGYSSTSINANIEAFIETGADGYPGTLEVTFKDDFSIEVKLENTTVYGTFSQEQQHSIQVTLENTTAEVSDWEQKFLDRFPTVYNYAYSSQFEVYHRDFIILWYEASASMSHVIILEKKE